MANRTIAIKITIDNRDAINAAKAQAIAMDSLGKETQKLNHLQAGLTSSFVAGNLAARAISISYLALRDSLQYAAQEAVLFQHNMTKIATITDAGKYSLESLEKTIKSLSFATNLNQNELAKTALEMSKMGLSSIQVENALGGVSKLAKALDEDLVRVGETVVSVINAYGFAAADADKISNQLSFTVKESALSIESFGTAFSYVGGTAKLAGVSFEELQASMDVLSNAGIKSSTIGTQLRRIITDLSNSHSDAAKAVGGTIESYGGLANAMEALGKKVNDVSGLSAIFGRTATSVAATLIDQTGTVKSLTEETKNLSDINTKMSNDMNTTMKSALDGVKVGWAGIGIEISKSTGFITTFVQEINKALKGLADYLQQKNEVDTVLNANPGLKKSIISNRINTKDVNGVVGNFPGTNDAIAQTPEYQVARAKYYQDAANGSIRENAPSLLKEALNKPQDQQQAAFTEIAMAFKANGTLEKFALALQEATRNLAATSKAKRIDAEYGGDDTDAAKPPKLTSDQKVANKRAKSASAAMLAYRDLVAPLSEENQNVKLLPDQPQAIGVPKGFPALQSSLLDHRSQNAELKKSMVEGDTGKSPWKLRVAPSDSSYDALVERQKKELEAHKGNQEAITALEKEHAAQRLAYNIQTSSAIIEGMASNFATMASQYKSFAAIAKAFMIADAIAKTYSSAIGAYNQAMGLPPPFGLIAAPIAAGVAVAAGYANVAKIKDQKFASGGEFLATSPTSIMVGDAGTEKVKITPRSKMGGNDSGGGGGGITVVIQGDVMDGAKFTDAVEMAQKRLNRRSV